jgi:hypothetical protein
MRLTYKRNDAERIQALLRKKSPPKSQPAARLLRSSSTGDRNRNQVPRPNQMNRRTLSIASIPRHRTHASPGQHKFTAAERDDLYQAFEKWKEQSPGE